MKEYMLDEPVEEFLSENLPQPELELRKEIYEVAKIAFVSFERRPPLYYERR